MKTKKLLMVFRSMVCFLFISITLSYANEVNLNYVSKESQVVILKHDVKKLMSYYSPKIKWWQDKACIYPNGCTGWINPSWVWANAVYLMTSYEFLTNDHSYQTMVKNVYNVNWRHIYPRRYMDDNLWWALALIRAYQVTKDKSTLIKAQRLVDYVAIHGKQNTCQGNGGVYWDLGKTQVGTIANMLYITANAKLYRITHKELYRQRANETWNWYKKSGLISKDYSIYDHYEVQHGKCGMLYTWTFTYNVGSVLSALASLAKINHDTAYIDYGKKIADKSMIDYAKNGIITENCDNVYICARNAFLFKGIYVYDLAKFAVATHDKQYILKINNYLSYNLQNLQSEQSKSSIYGFNWSLPVNSNRQDKLYNPADILTHLSAVYLELGNLLITQFDNQSLIKSNTENLKK